jgi:hypothetical protein
MEKINNSTRGLGKRPRSEDGRDRSSSSSRERDQAGETRSSSSSRGRDGEYASLAQSRNNLDTRDQDSSSPNSSSSTRNDVGENSSKANDSWRASMTNTISHTQSQRRSSIESVKSTTSSTSSGGFRRLKKFSPTSSAKNSESTTPSSSEKKKKKKKSTTSLSTSPSSKADDDLSFVSGTFQQTQLRLWQAAQERHKKVQEMQEQKRAKKSNKDRLEQPEDAATEKNPHDRTERRDSLNDNDEAAKTTHHSGKDKKKARDGAVEGEGDIEDAKARKKLKKLKKLQRLAEAERALQISTNRASSNISTPFSTQASKDSRELTDEAKLATTTTSSKTSEEVKKSTKKKRRLVKMMGSNNQEEPRKKKIKRIVVDNDDYRPSHKEPDDKYSNKPMVSTPQGKKQVSSKPGDSVLSTPLSFGLADTVKTRVRSCTKVKDELEL